MKESKEYRSLGHCRFCNEEIFGYNYNKLQAHQRFCKCNPNRQKALKQISDACQKSTSKEVHNRAAITKRNNAEKTYKVYTFTCKKCGKQFERKLKIKRFEEGYRIPQYCCNSCANGHIHSKEFKQKISNSITKFYREHPEKHTLVLMHNKGFISKPERIAIKWLKENIKNYIPQYRFEADDLIRYVDFYIPDEQLFIEIDGEYFHKERKDIDRHKDEIATKYGYKTLRISDSEDIEQRLYDYFNSLS